MIKEFREALEKNAAKKGGVGKVIEKILKTMWKYPRTTALTALGVGGSFALANKIHPLHQIASEERKRGLMKDQRALLKDILEEQRRGNYKPPAAIPQRLKKPPLT